MIDIEQYNRIKKKADQARADVQRAEGALDQVMKNLKDDFGCSTIEEAEAKLIELEEQEKAAEAAYQTELAAFQEKWGDLLK